MGFIEKSDVRKLLQDEKLINEIVEEALQDPDVIKGIASDMADELSDELEDNPEFRKKIIDAVYGNSGLKGKIVKEIVDDLS